MPTPKVASPTHCSLQLSLIRNTGHYTHLGIGLEYLQLLHGHSHRLAGGDEGRQQRQLVVGDIVLWGKGTGRFREEG